MNLRRVALLAIIAVLWDWAPELPPIPSDIHAAGAQSAKSKNPVQIRPSTITQNTLKVDTSVTPNVIEIGCETDQLGGTGNVGLQITGGASGVTMSAIACSGGPANGGITINALGTSGVTISGSATLTGTFTALTNQLILGASPNTTTINAPAPSGPITLTLPTTTDTLVGRNTIDTMTNKTISGPSFTATQFLSTVPAGSLSTPGDLVLAKSGFAPIGPGFGALTLRARPGTNPGTCKLVAAAGSSSTEVTIVDNVGSGC